MDDLIARMKYEIKILRQSMREDTIKLEATNTERQNAIDKYEDIIFRLERQEAANERG